MDFSADSSTTPSPQSAFVTCASSLTEGGQTSTHAGDTRALMTVVLLGGISQDDLTVQPHLDTLRLLCCLGRFPGQFLQLQFHGMAPSRHLAAVLPLRHFPDDLRVWPRFKAWRQLCFVGAVTSGDGFVVWPQFEHCDQPGGCLEKQTVFVDMIPRLMFQLLL